MSASTGVVSAPHSVSSSSAPPSTTASASSSARAIDPVAALFEQPNAVQGATPTAIYEGLNSPRGGTLRQSGLVLDLSPEFANRTSMGPAGLDAWIDPAPKKIRAMLTLSVVRDAAPLESKTVDAQCGALLFRAERWSDTTPVSSPRGARVWKGHGQGMNGEPWSVYVIDAPFEARAVRGCIGWRDSSPELESVVVSALRSIRAGEAPPNETVFK